MIDGNQMTICFHVDDYKLSHKSPKMMDDMFSWLKTEYGNVFEDGSGKMTVSRGKVHNYLFANDFGLYETWSSQDVDVGLHRGNFGSFSSSRPQSNWSEMTKCHTRRSFYGKPTV
jgi:hypothetical protein